MGISRQRVLSSEDMSLLPLALAALLPLFCNAEATVEKTSQGHECPQGFIACATDDKLCCSADGNVTDVRLSSRWCPPAQLWTEPVGSIICRTECCSQGYCNTAGNKVAINPAGFRQTRPPFDKGSLDNGNSMGCFMRMIPGCVFGGDRDSTSNTSCGFQMILEVKQINNEPAGNEIATTLNASVETMVKFKLIEDPLKPHMRTIEHDFDVEKAKSLVETHKDKLTAETLKKWAKGKKVTITWGFMITAWSYATHDDTFEKIGRDIKYMPSVKDAGYGAEVEKEEVLCFKVARDPVPATFFMEDVELNFKHCLQKCDCPKVPVIVNYAGACGTDGDACSGSSLSVSTMLAVVTTLVCLLLNW